MSKSEILAALKSLEATIDNYFAGINNNLKEVQSSLETLSSDLQSKIPTPESDVQGDDTVTQPISLTLFQTSVTQPNSLPESPSPIHSPNQNNETHFSDLNPHNPSPNPYTTRPTVSIDEESRSLTKSFPPIVSSDLLKSQSFGDLSEEFPPDLQGFSSDLQESLLDLKDSHFSLPTNIADSNLVLSKLVPQPQKPSTSTPPSSLSYPRENNGQRERWLKYRGDEKWRHLPRCLSRSQWLVNIDDWCDSISTERTLALSVLIPLPLPVMLCGEPPSITSLGLNQDFKRYPILIFN